MQDANLHGRAKYRRRTFVGAGVGVGLALSPLLPRAAQAQDADTAPPQHGDHFVHLSGAQKGEIVRTDDLSLGGPQVQVYPADPSGTVRNGSRLNLVLLARVGAEGLSEETLARSADGIVAYSAVCTHQACPVNMWSQEQQAFVCSCHASTYDPKNGAQVISGPAPRPLPALPLMSENGIVMVAGGFTRKVGATPV